MTTRDDRPDLPQASAGMPGGGAAAGAAPGQVEATSGQAHAFMVRDLVYQHVNGKPRLARLYQPAGTGPFPALVQVHGGAWNSKDRTDGQHAALELAAAGIVVLSIDFRNAPEAPYPASLQDINLAIRWLKAHAGEFGSSASRVGAYGTSSGGHQALLAALRAHDARYRAWPLPEAPHMDARLAFVVAGWPVLFPLARLQLARAAGRQDMVKSHATFFADEAEQLEATPALAIERGEKLHFPPALVFQGDRDEWTSVAEAEQLGRAYRGAGGSMEILFLEGERHTFLNEHPVSPNAVKAFDAVKAFIKKHGGGQAGG